MDKQDKIVVFAGIIILIISTIGIIHHEKTYVTTEEVKKTSYTVSWIEKSNELTDSGFVTKNEEWGKEYTLEAKNGVIYEIEIILEWDDNLDFHGLIFPWNWTDLIEANVNIEEFDFSQSQQGYNRIEIKANMEKPNDFKMEAKNESEVWNVIKEKERSQVNCKVNLTIYPKPRFFDRGNDIKLHIIYHYCIPEIKAS